MVIRFNTIIITIWLPDEMEAEQEVNFSEPPTPTFILLPNIIHTYFYTDFAFLLALFISVPFINLEVYSINGAEIRFD